MSAEPPEPSRRSEPQAGAPAPTERRPRRARPVADLPLDALAARSSEAARRWAIALIVATPIERVGEIPLETLAARAPALVERLARALASEAALEQLLELEAGEAETIDAIAGPARPASLAEAVEALRGVLWEMLLEELPRGQEPGSARMAGDLADRLAQSCAELLAAALRRLAQQEEGEPSAEALPAARPRGAPARAAAARVVEEPALEPPRAQAAAREEPREEPASIVIVDERRAAYAPIERPPFHERVAAAGETPRTPGEAEARLRAGLALEAHEPGAGRPPAQPANAREQEISIRDERAAEGPAAWIGSIGRQLQRHREDREPFAVLLLEIGGAAGGAQPAEPAALEEALAAELREGGGTLTRERAGRWWALAPHTDRLGAQALAVRLKQVADALSRRTGVPLTVAAGTAVCPEDGLEAPALAAHADIGLFAERAELAASRRGGAGETSA